MGYLKHKRNYRPAPSADCIQEGSFFECVSPYYPDEPLLNQSFIESIGNTIKNKPASNDNCLLMRIIKFKEENDLLKNNGDER